LHVDIPFVFAKIRDKRSHMGQIIKTLNAKPVSYGASRLEGNYVVYKFINFKDGSGNIHKIENLAIKTTIARELNHSLSALQVVDGSKINSFLGRNYVCAIQDKNGDIVTDPWPLQIGHKVNKFVAVGLTILVPLTVISPWFYIKAAKLKVAQSEVGAFEPLDNGFISTARVKKF
jgi:hypothetical protein